MTGGVRLHMMTKCPCPNYHLVGFSHTDTVHTAQFLEPNDAASHVMHQTALNAPWLYVELSVSFERQSSENHSSLSFLESSFFPNA